MIPWDRILGEYLEHRQHDHEVHLPCNGTTCCAMEQTCGVTEQNTTQPNPTHSNPRQQTVPNFTHEVMHNGSIPSITVPKLSNSPCKRVQGISIHLSESEFIFPSFHVPTSSYLVHYQSPFPKSASTFPTIGIGKSSCALLVYESLNWRGYRK